MKRAFRQRFWFTFAVATALAGGAASLLAQVSAPNRPTSRPSNVGGSAVEQRLRETRLSSGNTVQQAANTTVTDEPRQMLALIVWVVRLHDPTERGDDAAKAKLVERLNNLPAEFASTKDARDFVQQLKSEGRVRLSRELRFVALDGQLTRVQRGADQPQVTGTSQSNRGRTNAITYRATGTMIEALARVDSEKRIQVQFDYGTSELAKSNDVALTEDVDGKAQFADVIVSHQLKTAASLKNGGAVLVQSDSASGTADKSAEAQVELIILGGEIVQAGE